MNCHIIKNINNKKNLLNLKAKQIEEFQIALESHSSDSNTEKNSMALEQIRFEKLEAEFKTSIELKVKSNSYFFFKY